MPRMTNADAIHPGYGFLAENADFAEICESCKIKFIGPTSRMIRLMGDKAMAKQKMKKAGVPAELHVFVKGGHGYGIRGDQPASKWNLALGRWLYAMGWIDHDPQITGRAGAAAGDRVRLSRHADVCRTMVELTTRKRS